MRRTAAAVVGAVVVGAALAAAGSSRGARERAYPDAPPPATTGGFGEPTCAACHVPPASPDTSGTMTIEGLPQRYLPGCRYELTVVIVRPGMERSGFQLSARRADGPGRGLQAGKLLTPEAGTAVTEEAGIRYVHQTAEGSVASTPGRARWRVVWIAPRERVRVVFHAAGNAANDDASALGDVVYGIERSLEAAEPDR